MDTSTNGSTKARKRQERAQRILDAAQSTFFEKGFELTTTKEIAAAAGVTEPTIFNHFGSKAGILIQIIARSDAKLQLEIDEFIKAAGDNVHKEMSALMSLIVDRSLRCADERSWRYAMSISISDCDGEVGKRYHQQNKKLYDSCTRLMTIWAERGVVDSSADFLTARDLFERLNHSLFEDYITGKIPNLSTYKEKMESYVSLILRNTF